MKLKLLWLFTFATTITLVACKKSPVEDPHNHSLLGKSLDQVRAETRGDWYLVRGEICGFAGCNTTYIPKETADIISFLPNDTLKQTAHNGYPIYIYQKADSIRVNTDSYTFFFPSRTFSFTKVENDTLIAFAGSGEIGLIRKP